MCIILNYFLGMYDTRKIHTKYCTPKPHKTSLRGVVLMDAKSMEEDARSKLILVILTYTHYITGRLVPWLKEIHGG